MLRRTTQLNLHVRYDPERTDPDKLASALDEVLATALSTPGTPGILDEHGDPTVEPFTVEEVPLPFPAAVSRWKCPEAGCDQEAKLTFAHMAEIGNPICDRHDREMDLVGEDPPVAPSRHEDDEFLTAAQKVAYLASGCSRCPACGSEDILGTGTTNTDCDWHENEIACITCHARWNDVYTLTDVQGTAPPSEED